MKAVLIVHNAAIDSEVNEALQGLEVNRYSKFTGVLGKGEISEPHMNTDVWPGSNTGTLVIAEDEKAAQIMEKVRHLRKRLASEGIKAFMWQIEQVT